MTQLPKVKDTFVNAKTAQSILKTRAGKQAAQVFSNAADRFLRDINWHCQERHLLKSFMNVKLLAYGFTRQT
jgi:hypothetical protein